MIQPEFETIAQLRQENYRLQTELAQLRQENERLQRENTRSATEVAVSPSERRDRILEATATAANVLLTAKNLDEAVDTALQMIGEALDTDRIAIIEIEPFDDSSNLSLVGWQILNEWHSVHTFSQRAHSRQATGNHEGVEAVLELWKNGQVVSCFQEEVSEPFRSVMVEIESKAIHSVPIFIGSQFWGSLGIDDCREAKRRSPTELAVLKIAANCIGSAIQRDRTQKATLQAEQARSQELERLNAELQQTLDRLSESEERYRTLFELGREGFNYVEFEPPFSTALPIEEQIKLYRQNLVIKQVNSAFAAMYGIDNPDEIVGLKLADFHVEESETNTAFIRTGIENGYRWSNSETEEIDARGKIRYFVNTGFVNINEDGYAVSGWGTQIDITELRETQQALLQAERDRTAELVKANEALKQSLDTLATEPNLDKFLGHVLSAIAQLFQSPLTEYWYHPALGNIAYVGLSCVRGTLLTPEEQPGHPGAIGMPIPPEIINGEDIHHRHRYTLYQGIGTEDDPAGQWIAQQMGMDASGWYVDRGVTQYLNLPLNLGNRTIGALAVYLPGDRTFTPEQIELAQALAHQVTLAVQLTQLANQARESAILDERNRIAREIHDTLAQAFTGISIQLGVAQRIAPQDPEQAWNLIDRVTQLAHKGLTEARRSVWEICPNADEYRDLVHNIQQAIDQLTANTPLKTTVTLHGTPCLLPPELGMNLLRITQESITNTLRHARASTLSIDLSFEPTTLHLHIRDDGCGFEPKAHLDCGGFGLMAMQQRCDRFNGHFTLISQPGSGTEILIHIPIDSDSERSPTF